MSPAQPPRKARSAGAGSNERAADAKLEATSSLLLDELRLLIAQARQTAAIAVNAGLTLMYWRIGRRIQTEVLGGRRAGYGEQIVSTLSRQLSAEFGRSFSDKNLRHMMRFAEAFPDGALSRRCRDNWLGAISWS